MFILQQVNYPLNGPDMRRLDELNQELGSPPGLVTRATLVALLRADNILVVARDESYRIIGMGTLTFTPTLAGSRAVIEQVVTHRDARRQGVGSAIVERLVVCAWHKNASRYVSLTSHEGRSTQHFYEALGFVVHDTTTYRHYFTEQSLREPIARALPAVEARFAQA